MATFTEKELEISNKSYTNKDFEAIYTELLTYAQKLSTRFSPVDSNETDPFVILLKLAAFVADKVNYNVDKNILERFMLSCTQEQSMRELTSMLGYHMHYYQAAETDVLFKYNFPTDYDGPDIIEIPQYSIVTNGDNIQYVTISQTAISKQSGISTAITAIQGKLKTLTVNDNEIIQLENLNANNIVYFKEAMVAENGVFITNAASSETWTQVYNLNTEIYGSAVYKFGFDSVKGLPYLEFPEWISDIIGDGLKINYIITDGIAGNVTAKELKSVSRLSKNDNISDEDIIVYNASAAISGQDPETIDASYKGFKKIIGTFDTLVTCRDYANKIYNLVNTYGVPYVSNVQVGDRRSDINYSCDVVTATNVGSQVQSIIPKKYDVKVNAAIEPEHLVVVDAEAKLPAPTDPKTELGVIYKITSTASYKQCKEKISASGPIRYWDDYYVLPEPAANLENKIYNVLETDEYFCCRKLLKLGSSDPEFRWIKLSDEELEDVISPYDLCIYGLKPISNTSHLAVNDENGYNKSFNLISNGSKAEEIKNKLEECKTSSHTYKKLSNSDIASIRNYYKLNATVSTVRKINPLEEKEILLNINNALIAKYNSRNLSFGYEIAFDELLKTIEDADSRIKSVSLQEPEQSAKIALANNTEIDLYDTDGIPSDQFKFIVAKNVLSGRVSAFKYDETFDYSYIYNNVDTKDNIILISTECNIQTFPQSDSLTSYKLRDNETIQFLAPRLITKATYPYGINYYLKLQDGNDHISAESEYMLKDGDEFVITYVDNNDETIIVPYQASGNYKPIIKPNINLYTSSYRQSNNETPTKIGVANLDYPDAYRSSTYVFYTLGTNDEVEYRELNMEELKTFKRCYWLTNHTNNAIPWVTTKDNPDIGYYILDDGEYFFYTDSALSSLYAFGSGTKLVISGLTSHSEVIWKHNKYVDIDSITLDGLAALGDVFEGIAFNNSDFKLAIYENELITITSGDILEVITPDKPYTFANNVFTDLAPNMLVRYKFEGEEQAVMLPDRSSLISSSAGATYNWQARAILDINAGPDSEQILQVGQKVILISGIFDDLLNSYIPNPNAYTDNGEIDTESPSVTVLEGTDAAADVKSFKFNTPIQIGGGVNLSLQYLDLDLMYKCPNLMTFTRDLNVIKILQDYGTGFYGLNFRPLESEEGAIEIVRKLNTNPSRQFEIKPISGINQSPSVSDAVQANNIYYKSGIDYYQVARNCNVRDITESDSLHDALNSSLHDYRWVKVDAPKTFDRYMMLYISGINPDKNAQVTLKGYTSEGVPIESLQKINVRGIQPNASSTLSLTNGINIIRIKDMNGGDSPDHICSYVTLTATSDDSDDGYKARNSIAVLLGTLRIVEGINPLLGLGTGDASLLAFLDYLKTNFPHQFTDFFMLSDIDNVKEIELTETYKLSSAQAFYDSNNIANKWTICKIDFPNSDIKIARSSKK